MATSRRWDSIILSLLVLSASVIAQSNSTESSSTSSETATSTGTADSHASQPARYKVIGVLLAVGSGLFIGSSFVFKKKGLLSAQAKAKGQAGEGHAYLKSPLWWTGMILMIVGEVMNLVAYSFASAIIVTPMGALSVVICAILSSIFLKERLTLFGKVGCGLCILGAVIIALNGPAEQTVGTIKEFQKLFLSVGFLVFGSLVIAISLGMIFFVAPRWGKENMLVYITICSLLGGLSVACTSGLGASILTSIRGNNQFKHWFIYFLLGFVVVTLLAEINYLNKALELFNTAAVTPTYFTIFTACTLLTSAILFQGFRVPVPDVITVVLAFLVICCGITLLQMSKIDPEEIKIPGLDRKTTLLMRAARSEVHHDGDVEKGAEIEDPGIDSIRGGFGAIGSIHRAMSARRSMRREGSFDPSEVVRRRNQGRQQMDTNSLGMGVVRHQLYDNPMPNDYADKISMHSAVRTPTSPRFPLGEDESRPRATSISFAQSEMLHRYPASHGDALTTTHEERDVDERKHVHAAAPSIPPVAFSADGHAEREASVVSTVAPPPFVSSAYHDPYATGASSSGTPPEFGGKRQGTSSTNSSQAASTSQKGRFHLPQFRHRSPSRERDRGHRVAHPAGPPELDKQESQSLVHRTQEVESDDEREEDGNVDLGGGGMSSYRQAPGRDSREF